ncbi:uncharacterized protein LOC122864139 isoform X3 [Siniperca chuatsi]|uniref:uncharacterized protein LOC122864139 isoform X3 n=1 Tax=Siniperca chuatsi TaxID=119488 RepID=UPI001CE173B7|nr:uncharacterized protein LOC122864139 isoform X3 [Siniperca chuatsi]
MRVSNREKMMLPEDPWMPLTPKQFMSAFAPFPRSTWIHTHVPNDNFDRVCKNIWRRAKEAKDELGRGQSSPQRQQNNYCTVPDNKTSHRAEEQQKEKDDLGLSTQNEEDKQQYHTDFTLPCPYLLGRRHPHVARPAREASPAMEGEMKQNEEAKGKRNLEKDAEDKQRSVESSLKKIWVPQSSSRRETQSSAPQPQPLATDPVCSATEDHTPHLQDEEESPLPSTLPRDTCESEDEHDIRSSSDSNSSDDDDVVTLPGVRTCATDSSNDDSASDNNDCSEEENEIPHSCVELSSDGEQDSPTSSTEKDFPPLSTIKAGILPCPTEPPASGKMHGQWEIPLSFHPHDIPTVTLASGVTAHAQAPVQGKAEAPQANLKSSAPSADPMQQEAYDLLADFPALQPPKKPLALGVLCDGNPKTKKTEGKRGLTHSPNRRQESRASHQRRMENVPHKVSSICAGDQKSVLDLQIFGSISQRISCEELKASNQLPPRVAGTDGVGVNARSWASAAKAGMKQAAAPQEKARPCTFQQIVTINRAKARYSAAQNFANKATPSNQAASPPVTAMCQGPRPRNPNRFVRPGYPPTHLQYGAQAHRANCPPGFRYPRFPLQQARGNPSKQPRVTTASVTQ